MAQRHDGSRAVARCQRCVGSARGQAVIAEPTLPCTPRSPPTIPGISACHHAPGTPPVSASSASFLQCSTGCGVGAQRTITAGSANGESRLTSTAASQRVRARWLQEHRGTRSPPHPPALPLALAPQPRCLPLWRQRRCQQQLRRKRCRSLAASLPPLPPLQQRPPRPLGPPRSFQCRVGWMAARPRCQCWRCRASSVPGAQLGLQAEGTQAERACCELKTSASLGLH